MILQDSRSDYDQLVRDLMEYKALRKDNEINNQLLKELVMKYSAAEQKLSLLNRELVRKQELLEEDLEAAAGIQQALLPKMPTSAEKLDIAWRFEPCEHVGGDIFNVFWLDDHRHLGCYVLDVSGHGVPAAMVTVSVSQMFQGENGGLTRRKQEEPPFYRLAFPSEVMSTLDEAYPMERFDKYFTMTYLIIDTKDLRLQYSNAAHPPPLLLRKGIAPEPLKRGGTIVGMGGVIPFEDGQKTLAPGDKLILHTDGITEYQNREGTLFGDDRFHELLEQMKDRPVAELVKGVYEEFMSFGDGQKIQDDVTLLGFEFLL